MATYVLPDNFLNEEQRKRYFYELVPDDAVEITYHVMEHFPAVFDDAVRNTARVNRLRALRTKPQGARS